MKRLGLTMSSAMIALSVGSASAATSIAGQVQAGGAPVAASTVTLWAASGDAPKQLAQAKTADDGTFTLALDAAAAPGQSLYLIAKGGVAAANKGAGDNPALAFLAVLGGQAPAKVTINEMTTVASAWTNAQFLDGTVLKGPALSLSIAAGNVPNFVDLASGGWGGMIQDPLNSQQTPTMANFATLADVFAGCATRVTVNACDKLFIATTPPKGDAPTDTLTAAEAIAHNQGYKAERVFALLDAFYPVPKGKPMRAVPFLPYLSLAPGAWTLPLKFAGGGSAGNAKVMFDGKGNAWIGANFMVGWQGHDDLWNGNLAKFASDGHPLSPPTTGFTGGGMLGPGFGTAIDSNDHVWVDSTSGQTISLFDNDGKPLSPPEGYNFGGKLKTMQGVIVTPSGDVWALDFGDDKVVYLPKGDPSQAKFYCQLTNGRPNKDSACKLNGPFALAIDQQDRIWITNAIGDTVTRFPASDPSKVEIFKTGGGSGKGMAIDSKGNAWVTNTAGAGLSLAIKLHLLELKLRGATLSAIDHVVVDFLESHPGLGSVSMLRPDGSQAPGSPFNPGSIWGAWAVSIDGNDHAWISNFAPGGGLTELCGARVETCPPGMKTGDPISPKGGYKGGGMQLLVDASIDPAGDVWTSNNWQDYASCYGAPAEGLTTRCGGQGIVVFYGMAKPVRAPQIGPSQSLE